MVVDIETAQTGAFYHVLTVGMSDETKQGIIDAYLRKELKQIIRSEYPLCFTDDHIARAVLRMQDAGQLTPSLPRNLWKPKTTCEWTPPNSYLMPTLLSPES